jgi:lipoate-protein ligase A
VLGSWKIAGSAQRRRRGAVLQHGSILLGRSPKAPELPGIQELSDQAITASGLIEAWSPRLAARLGTILQRGELGERQTRRARELVAERFGADRFTRQR